MRNMNQIRGRESLTPASIETGWDELTKLEFEQRWDKKIEPIDFRNRNAVSNHSKDEIRNTVSEMKINYNVERLNAEAFILILLGRLQPSLSVTNLCHVYDDYEFWKEALGEIQPIIAGYWAECDPMIIRYLFTVFISQFLVILELWERVRFSRIYMEDCAMLGEFYINMDILQNEILLGTVSHWGIEN